MYRSPLRVRIAREMLEHMPVLFKIALVLVSALFCYIAYLNFLVWGPLDFIGFGVLVGFLAFCVYFYFLPQVALKQLLQKGTPPPSYLVGMNRVFSRPGARMHLSHGIYEAFWGDPQLATKELEQVRRVLLPPRELALLEAARAKAAHRAGEKQLALRLLPLSVPTGHQSIDFQMIGLLLEINWKEITRLEQLRLFLLEKGVVSDAREKLVDLRIAELQGDEDAMRSFVASADIKKEAKDLGLQIWLEALLEAYRETGVFR